ELQAHPARVIRGEVRWRKAELKWHGYLELEVTLTNVGTLPVRFANPFHGPELEWNGLRVGLAQKGTDDKQIDLTPKDMLARESAPTGAKLELAPGKSVSFTARHKFPFSPGRYDTFVLISSGEETPTGRPEERDPELVGGILWLYPGPIK